MLHMARLRRARPLEHNAVLARRERKTSPRVLEEFIQSHGGPSKCRVVKERRALRSQGASHYRRTSGAKCAALGAMAEAARAAAVAPAARVQHAASWPLPTRRRARARLLPRAARKRRARAAVLPARVRVPPVLIREALRSVPRPPAGHRRVALSDLQHQLAVPPQKRQQAGVRRRAVLLHAARRAE
jgi:hypothetical protein